MRKQRLLSFYILLITVLTVFCLSGCKQQEQYEWEGHKPEDMLLLFEEQKIMFIELVDIFSTNDSFWEQCRQYEDDSTAWLMSPYDENKMSVFSEQDQTIITDFFEQTRPYMISVRTETITFSYINEAKTDGFSFVYYYGNTLEKWLRSADGHPYSNFLILGDNWFAYIPEESSQQ